MSEPTPPSRHPRRRFLVVVIALLVVIVGAAATVYLVAGRVGNPAALKRVCQNGYCLSLPASWRYRDASYPSDHATYFYWNPDNALEQLTIVNSGCIGCVTTNNYTVPNPAGELPQSVTAQHEVSPYEIRYTAFEGRSPYPTEGFVYLPHNDKGVSGSVIFALDLPQSKHPLAQQIIDSFALR